jgi:hypothetical protein
LRIKASNAALFVSLCKSGLNTFVDVIQVLSFADTDAFFIVAPQLRRFPSLKDLTLYRPNFKEPPSLHLFQPPSSRLRKFWLSIKHRKRIPNIDQVATRTVTRLALKSVLFKNLSHFITFISWFPSIEFLQINSSEACPMIDNWHADDLVITEFKPLRLKNFACHPCAEPAVLTWIVNIEPRLKISFLRLGLGFYYESDYVYVQKMLDYTSSDLEELNFSMDIGRTSKVYFASSSHS